jgi:hypothetical protein
MSNPIKDTLTRSIKNWDSISSCGEHAGRGAERIAHPQPLPQDFIDGVRRAGEWGPQALERERESLPQEECLAPYFRNRFEFKK